MISCRKAAQLVHKKHTLGLSRGEKISLKVHTKMCKACNTFEKQTSQIEKAIESRLRQNTESIINLQPLKKEITSKLVQ